MLADCRHRVVWLLLVTSLARASTARAGFVTFESGQVRPLALSPDGTRLFAVNTPDDRLEVFDVSAAGLTHTASVPVGLEPVAVAARTNTEVWVVNHLSDSVSLVDVSGGVPRVVRTLLVGDEPRDIVFAGPGGSRAFITTAHRGQQRTSPDLATVPGAGDPQLITPGVGRADVWVFDATALGTNLGGTPLTIVTLFGDTPRALAVAPGGGTVYAAVFHSGNRTTTLNEGAVCNGGAAVPPCVAGGVTLPGGLPPPNTNVQGIHQPETGLIVRRNATDTAWEDDLGRDWSAAVRFSLPDKDVFALDATATPPVETSFFTSVGTILFNMAVNPVSGKVYVTNTEARNEVRFEGPGVFGGTTVRGHLHEARISVLAAGTVTPRHLNKHIDYDVVPSPAGVKEKSLATPTGMAVSSDGGTLYVAAFGSSKVGVFSTAALEADTFVPDAADHIGVSGGGPSGLVLDEPRGRLYVFTRFDNAVSVVDVATRAEVAHLPLFNPEPPSVVTGRRFLYDATFTSSNGEAACASCHIFGDFDSLAWDLGNPDDVVMPNLNVFRLVDVIGLSFDGFHPLKGPMTTQSLRGMANHGPMHWRGDRTGANVGQSLNEDLAFKAFNVAFDGLLGRGGPLAAADMQAFTNFILQVTYPPNPIRHLDNTLTPDQQAGRNFYFGPTSDVFGACNNCHVLDPANGFFGTDGESSFEGEPQEFKIPHLRNAYQKVGMFGQLEVGFTVPFDTTFKGDQVRGFGYLHDGSFDTVFRFMHGLVFSSDFAAFGPNPGGFPTSPLGEQMRRQVESFVLAFDSNLAPIVGQQTTLTSTNLGSVEARLDLLEQRAAAGECDLVVKGLVGPTLRGWLRTPAGFTSDYADEPPLSSDALRALAAVPGGELTYTCVPPGSGIRIALDHDDDGVPDASERDEGTDPDDPASVPPGGALPFTKIATKRLVLTDRTGPPANPSRRRLVFKSVSNRLDPPALRILPPLGGSAGDPTLNGGSLAVYNAGGLTGDRVNVALPAGKWKALQGSGGGYRFADSTANAPVASVKVKGDRIVVVARRGGFAYTLDESAQGKVAVRLALGGGIRWCAVAPGAEDRVDHFAATPNSPAPAFCPPQP